MKANIHPVVNKVVFIDVTCGIEFVTTSTLKSDKTKKIDGVEHYIIEVESSSGSHPFYTGKRRDESRNNQVAKYMAKVAAAQKNNQPKKAKEETEEKN